jgi:hypothetical protein
VKPLATSSAAPFLSGKEVLLVTVAPSKSKMVVERGRIPRTDGEHSTGRRQEVIERMGSID